MTPQDRDVQAYAFAMNQMRIAKNALFNSFRKGNDRGFTIVDLKRIKYYAEEVARRTGEAINNLGEK